MVVAVSIGGMYGYGGIARAPGHLTPAAPSSCCGAGAAAGVDGGARVGGGGVV